MSGGAVETIWRSRGYLPHYELPGAVQHVIFGLADAVPAIAARNVTTAAPWERAPAVEAILDAGYGQRALADPRAAGSVQQALLYHDVERYNLLAWCVMPTHVHALVAISSSWPLARVVHSWKSFTANVVNRRLGRSGALWMREYFDRAVRSEDHLDVVRTYIENNPVAAGLVTLPDLWPWSSAGFKDAGWKPALRR